MANKKNVITAEAINARRAYQRKWREENRERIRAYNADYWARKAAEAKETPTS
jgi:predicted transposase YbfD/YdcC